jgi:hypothetical protein
MNDKKVKALRKRAWELVPNAVPRGLVSESPTNKRTAINHPQTVRGVYKALKAGKVK